MNVVDRAKRMLLSPRTEWEVIGNEPSTPAQLFTGYAMPLAAIGPVAQIIGYSVFGISVPFAGHYRVPIGSAISSALVTYVLPLAGTYVLGLIVDALAPTFKGRAVKPRRSRLRCTPAPRAGWRQFSTSFPADGSSPYSGLYSLYLLYLGLPVSMKSPRDKAVPYTAVVVVAAIMLFMLTGMLAGRFLPVSTAGSAAP